jgi:hypothetical protein
MLLTCTYLWFGRWLQQPSSYARAQRIGTDLEALACSSSVSDGQPNQNRPLEGRHCPVAPLLPKNRPSQIPARTRLQCKSVHCDSMFLDTLHITLSAECSKCRPKKSLSGRKNECMRASPVSIVPAPIFVLVQSCQQVPRVEAGCCGHREGNNSSCPCEVGEGVGQRQNSHTYNSCDDVKSGVPPAAVWCCRTCNQMPNLSRYILLENLVLATQSLWLQRVIPWEHHGIFDAL